MNKPYAILAFVTGALLGVSVTGTILKIKYAKDLEREVDSVIESFSAAPRVIFKDKNDLSETKESEVDPTPKLTLVNDEGIDVAKGFYYSPENDEQFKPRVKKYYDEHGNELVVDEEEDEDGFPVLTEEDVLVYSDPYPISPDEFAQLIEDGYSVSNWTLYNGSYGKVLADDNDEIVTQGQLETTIGKGLEHMGEYEEDIAFVANDRLRCVIEITEDLRNYSDVVKAMPFIAQ